MRVNQGQEFVIGGYTVGTKTFDALIFGYYEKRPADLRGAHAQRVHAGRRAQQLFTSVPRPRDRRTARSPICPRRSSGRWGQGLTKAKMADCRWLKPVLVGQFEFLEWTGDESPAARAVRRACATTSRRASVRRE